MAAEVTSNVDEFMNALEPSMSNRLEDAAEVLLKEILQLLSQPSPPESDPYQVPHERTGKLENSWRIEKDEDHVEVISDSMEAFYMELGTRFVAPRPFVNQAVDNAQDDMVSVIVNGTQISNSTK